MCGIVGYIGKSQAAPIILDGLAKLEYRGYDSAGMAIFDGEKINIEKSVGRLKVLENLTRGGATMPGFSGIGHTRWATHGVPSDVNSHPHFNKNQTIAVVHNGIIENYIPLKKKMIANGYEFVSETDTEVLAHLLDYYYKGNPLEAITKVLHRVEGSYALGILFSDHPKEIYAVRKDSPLIVGQNEDGCFIASDVPAILKYTRTVTYVDNQEVVKLSADELHFYTVDEEEIQKESVTIDWDANAAEKGGYEHFMLKEIYEQPKTVTDTISPRIKDGDIVIDELNMTDEELKAVRRIHIVACGSAYHTGVTAKYILEGLCRVPVEVDVASEFRYRNPILEEGSMVIVISQSGETADTLAALREAKKRGFSVLGIVNVVGKHTARIISLINPYTRLSCKVKKNDKFGTLIWNGEDYRYATLIELPRDGKYAKGDSVVTSGYSSLFPEGIMVGIIEGEDKAMSSNFMAMKVKLSTNFSQLKNVSAIHNKMKVELKALESKDDNPSGVKGKEEKK